MSDSYTHNTNTMESVIKKQNISLTTWEDVPESAAFKWFFFFTHFLMSVLKPKAPVALITFHLMRFNSSLKREKWCFYKVNGLKHFGKQWKMPIIRSPRWRFVRPMIQNSKSVFKLNWCEREKSSKSHLKKLKPDNIWQSVFFYFLFFKCARPNSCYDLNQQK